MAIASSIPLSSVRRGLMSSFALKIVCNDGGMYKIPVFIKFLLELAAAVPVHRYT